MIRYALVCEQGHEFESWFRAIADFDRQVKAGLVTCPECQSAIIEKQPMAPAISGTHQKAARSFEENRKAVAKTLRAFKQTIIANSEDVGSRFAEEARKIHHGEAPERSIRGETTAEDAQKLIDDEIPFGVLPEIPEDHN